jgi:hypothetical protein
LLVTHADDQSSKGLHLHVLVGRKQRTVLLAGDLPAAVAVVLCQLLLCMAFNKHAACITDLCYAPELIQHWWLHTSGEEVAVMMSKRVQQLDVAVETKTRVRAHIPRSMRIRLRWTPAPQFAGN